MWLPWPRAHAIWWLRATLLLHGACRQAAGDMRLMNPVSHVENHPRCRTNGEGEPLLPTDQPWRQQLAMFLVSSKLLIDTEEVLQVKQDAPATRAQCVSSFYV